MEGLSVATPVLQPYVVPITIAIIVVLFLFQRHGTTGVGKVFGPVTLLWFAVLAILGVLQIARYPSVLQAVNPLYGVEFFLDTGWHGYLVLGSVFLVVTGGEALYADMGHFGTRPIRIDWFAVVLPALLLNYFGQGALLLQNPAAAENPFYLLAPSWAIYPLIVLAVAAAVIASQAVISGAFSLTMQAVQLGFSPRIRIDHTSTRQFGQIYIGGINWALMIGCILIVLGFRTSSNLAAAYGVAVTSTMVITTMLLYVVARERWGWNALTAGYGRDDLPHRRPRVLRRQHHQGGAGRLAAARPRGRGLHSDDDVEERAPRAGRADSTGGATAGGVPRASQASIRLPVCRAPRFS